MSDLRCSTDGCERDDIHARGMCVMHYKRIQVQGSMPTLTLTVADRLASGLVRMPNGCLEWIRTTTAKGYGQIGVNGKVIYTHRLAWGLAHPGELLPPLVRHFVCDNPPCCDVTHLRPGTAAQNTADMMAKGRGRGGNRSKTHCTHGHLFDKANTYVDSDGHRSCRACHASRARIRRENRKAQVKS